MHQRSTFIDFARVAAILLMIVYHAAFDMQVYWGWDMDVLGGGWLAMGRITASTFLFLVGLSFTLSWRRTPLWQKYLRRGVTILGYGLAVSLATYVLDPETYVRFGILHLIGVATVLLPFFVRFGKWNIALGLLTFLIGTFTKGHVAEGSLLLPLGLMPPGFRSVDYFPLLPWLGVILLGVAFGTFRFSKRLPEPKLPRRIAGIITAISKKSLLIYMVHQPILIILLRIVLGQRD